jgi:hypothetical protein
MLKRGGKRRKTKLNKEKSSSPVRARGRGGNF